ncbi:MAG TPA: hypothetical protein VGC64_11550 [Pyrinomonadaceae bacterium]|jgi:hypothetical protein
MKIGSANQLDAVRRHAEGLILRPLKQLFGLLLKTILTCSVFYLFIAVALSSMGYPIPRLSDVGHYLGRLTELAKILS